MNRNIKLVVAYDGTNFHGFQRQTNALSVQEVIEDGLAKICSHKVVIFGAGRTDSGVHAYGQVVNFYTNAQIPTEKIPYALKGLLPPDIAIKKAEEVSPAFHARYGAKSKVYRYKIYNDRLPDPFMYNYAWHIPNIIDRHKMWQAAQVLIGEHDFSSFQAAGSSIVSPIRNLYSISYIENGSLFELVFKGNGFLYHMVRNIVGTLYKVGVGKIDANQLQQILMQRNRSKAGITAPAKGLYLEEVCY